MINKDLSLYKAAASVNTDLIVFPLVAAFLLFVNNITTKTFDINGITNINAWAGSFATSFLAYMLFDILLSKVVFFKKHRYIFIGVSFIVSTFLSNCIQYDLISNFDEDAIRKSIPIFVVDFCFLVFMVLYGLKIGISKTIEKKKKAEEQYTSLITKMNEEERNELVNICKSAIEIDDDVFEFIVCSRNKESVKQILEDLNKIGETIDDNSNPEN